MNSFHIVRPILIRTSVFMLDFHIQANFAQKKIVHFKCSEIDMYIIIFILFMILSGRQRFIIPFDNISLISY